MEVESRELRRMLMEDPEALYKLADRIGISVDSESSPENVLTRILHLADRVDDIPDLGDL